MKKFSISSILSQLLLLFFVIIWIIPTFGLFISSLRDKDLLAISGWWTSLTTTEVNEIYRIMDLFCLPSYREGLPYTILEAMMTGIPVIASNIRGNREIVTSNETGLLCLPNDVETLKNAIQEFIQDADKRNLCSEKALKNVLGKYHIG